MTSFRNGNGLVEIVEIVEWYGRDIVAKSAPLPGDLLSCLVYVCGCCDLHPAVSATSAAVTNDERMMAARDESTSTFAQGQVCVMQHSVCVFILYAKLETIHTTT